MLHKKNAGLLFYYAGLALVFFALVGAELIWLPAPMMGNGGMEWIEIIDWLVMALAVIPLCWMAGAIIRLKEGRRKGALLQGIRYALVAASFVASLLIAMRQVMDMLEFLIGSAAAAVLLVFADMIASEIITAKSFPWRSGAVLAASLALCAVTVVPTGNRVTYPGMTMNLNRYAHMEGGEPGGTIEGVLVFDRPAVLADRLFGKLLPQYVFQPTPKNQPPLSETYAQVVAMKNDANEVAAAIAIQKTGLGEGVIREGALVTAVVEGSPAENKIRGGDVIEAINGTTVLSPEDLVAYMAGNVKPGDTVAVTLNRQGQRLVTEVAAVAAEGDAARPVMGIAIQAAVRLENPRDISFGQYIAHLGGPSHGAMMTLAFIDQLTPGGITGGLNVAGTGTIEIDGSIGMVGGIPQKAYAVSRTKADVFFVPAAGYDAAVQAAPELIIVAVRHIDDVLAWLEKGG